MRASRRKVTMFVRIFILICNLLIPLTMFGFGLYFENHPPKRINNVFGYRTKQSMKNADTWQFAHHFCGRLWKWLGIILFAAAILFTAFTWHWEDISLSYACLMLLLIQAGVLIGSIFPTERALKNTFDEQGRRR